MRFETDDYIAGHSSVMPDEEIILGDRCGRFIPISLESVEEVIGLLEQFVPFKDNRTVSPEEFIKEGRVLEPDYIESIADVTFSEDGLLYWRGSELPADDLPGDVYRAVLTRLEDSE